jgi:hypothetical protein
MFSCRAGAAQAVAVESVRHLCEAAETATALSNVRVVHKDARYVELCAPGKPGGDLDEQADVIVFEVSKWYHTLTLWLTICRIALFAWSFSLGA